MMPWVSCARNAAFVCFVVLLSCSSTLGTEVGNIQRADTATPEWPTRVLPSAAHLSRGIQHASGECDDDSALTCGQSTTTPTNTLDIPAFVISNLYDFEKHEQVTNALGSAGFSDIRFVPFVAAHQVNVTDMLLSGQITQNNLDAITNFRYIGAANLHKVLSLFINHVQALQLGVEANHEIFGVFEDDVMLAAAPETVNQMLAEALSELPKSADMLYLEYCYEICSQHNYKYLCIVRAVDPKCTAGILFTRKGAKSALAHIKTMFSVLDGMYSNLISHGVLEAYLMTPPVLLQDGYWSYEKCGGGYHHGSFSEENMCSSPKAGDRACPRRTHRLFSFICSEQTSHVDLTVLQLKSQSSTTIKVTSSDTFELVEWRHMFQQGSLSLSYYNLARDNVTNQLIGQVPWEKHCTPVTLTISDNSLCWPSFDCTIDVVLTDDTNNKLAWRSVTLNTRMLTKKLGLEELTPAEDDHQLNLSDEQAVSHAEQPELCAARPKFGLHEFRKRIPAEGGPKAFIYSCRKGGKCGGLGDRMVGMVSVFMLAVLTNRSFAIEIDQPLPLEDFLIPNEYDWMVKYPDTSVVHWMDGCHVPSSNLSIINLEKEFEDQPVVRIQANMELFSRLRINPFYAADAEIMYLNLWFPHFYSVMFKPTAELQSAGNHVFKKMMTNDVSCAQMRLLTDERFHAANAYCGPDSGNDCDISWIEHLYPSRDTSRGGTRSRTPADFLLQSDDVQMVWNTLHSRPEHELIFVSSDSKGILIDAARRFGDRLLVVHTEIAHLEHGPFFNDLMYTFATFHAFQFCKSMVFSRSGFGELGASMLQMNASTSLVLQTQSRSWKVDPCKFFRYKEDCGGWLKNGFLFAGLEEYVDNDIAM